LPTYVESMSPDVERNETCAAVDTKSGFS